MELIKEGKAAIKITLQKTVSKEMDVFYNPVMKLNRDIAVLLLNSVNKKDMQLADPLAASGIRSIRFIKELKKGKLKSIDLNDISQESVRQIKSNFKLNKINLKTNRKKIMLHKEDANLFLLNSAGFDYIDIDPFGYPGRFLNNACARLARGGILAVTATDTAALSGTFPSACQRKYWAKPMRNYLMHEVGLRILIRHIQLIAAMHEKALVPIFSHSNDHYIRVYFVCEKGKEKCDDIIKQHKYFLFRKKDNLFKASSSNSEQDFEFAGPLWIGSLWDERLVKRMVKQTTRADNKKLSAFLKTLLDEAELNRVGFYDIHFLAKVYKLQIPPKRLLLEKLKKSGFKASETHLSKYGIRTNSPLKELVKIIKSLNIN